MTEADDDWTNDTARSAADPAAGGKGKYASCWEWLAPKLKVVTWLTFILVFLSSLVGFVILSDGMLRKVGVTIFPGDGVDAPGAWSVISGILMSTAVLIATQLQNTEDSQDSHDSEKNTKDEESKP